MQSIFVDARMIGATGIGRHLAAHLAHLTGFKLIAGVRDEAGAARVKQLSPNAEVLKFDSKIYSYGEHWRGSLLARSLKSRVALFWYPHYNAPWWTPSPTVVTVHDLIHINLPMLGWNKVRAQAARQVLRRAVGNARRVICVSSATAADLARFEPKVAEKVRVVPNKLSPLWRASTLDEQSRFRHENGLERYLLLVGNKKPHKNQSLAFRVMDALAEEFPDLKLVVIGKREASWNSSIKAWKADGGKVDRLIDLEHVSDERLRHFYSAATLLLMPSLYEGFGYPPLEAMACGVPVICSTQGALRQTVGEAAITLEPLDFSAWIGATKKLLYDEELRRKLVSLGFARATSFLPGGADELRTVFEEAIDDHLAVVPRLA